MADTQTTTGTLQVTNAAIKQLKAYVVADIEKDCLPLCLLAIYLDQDTWRFTTIRQIKSETAILPVYRSYCMETIAKSPFTQICAFAKLADFVVMLTAAVALKDELYITIDGPKALMYFDLQRGPFNEEDFKPTMPKCRIIMRVPFTGTKNINGTPRISSRQLLLIRLDGALHKTLYSYINKVQTNAIISFHIERAVRDDQQTTGSSANITIKNDMVTNKPLILKTFVPIDMGVLPRTYVVGVKNEHLKHAIFMPKKVSTLATMFMSLKTESSACVDFKLVSSGGFLVARVPLAFAIGNP